MSSNTRGRSAGAILFKSDRLGSILPVQVPSRPRYGGAAICGDGARQTKECGCPVYAGLSDGPYRTEHLQSKLIGRVLGVAFTALGNQLPTCAGWEDEEAGNAAFDPTEYLDVLIRTGHEPRIYRGHYFEKMPDRALTRAEDAAVMAVRCKYAKASKAHARVCAECVRRGLADDRRSA
jgi:hypothetical protein